MTVIVSVKINDGIVLASDSASTFGSGQIYHNADKIVNLVKGLPIGAMVTGNGGIGNESIARILKDLRTRFSGRDSLHQEWALDPATYTMQQVAQQMSQFLSEKIDADTYMRLRIAGYSAGRPLPELWDLLIHAGQLKTVRIHDESSWGLNWDGEYEALNRLVFGAGNGLIHKIQSLDASDERLKEIQDARENEHAILCIPAMPVQDAIDLAKFLVETTIGFLKFAVFRQPKTVGGPIEIAAITKHEGFRWVQRKHFYPIALNPQPAA